MDVFDGLPDPIIIDILNEVGEVKTILRCSSLSKRFNSLVPQSDSLLLILDHPESDSPWLQQHSPLPIQRLSLTIPSKILSRFNQVRSLNVELPVDDVKLEKGAVVKWKAEFGKTLKSCVVVAFRSAAILPSSVAIDGESDAEFVTGMKTRVLWTISALMVASSRHYLMSKVVKEHVEMESLVIRDVEGDGTVMMKSEGLSEFRLTEVAREKEEEELVVRKIGGVSYQAWG